MDAYQTSESIGPTGRLGEILKQERLVNELSGAAFDCRNAARNLANNVKRCLERIADLEKNSKYNRDANAAVNEAKRFRMRMAESDIPLIQSRQGVYYGFSDHALKPLKLIEKASRQYQRQYLISRHSFLTACQAAEAWCAYTFQAWQSHSLAGISVSQNGRDNIEWLQGFDLKLEAMGVRDMAAEINAERDLAIEELEREKGLLRPQGLQFIANEADALATKIPQVNTDLERAKKKQQGMLPALDHYREVFQREATEESRVEIEAIYDRQEEIWKVIHDLGDELVLLFDRHDALIPLVKFYLPAALENVKEFGWLRPSASIENWCKTIAPNCRVISEELSRIHLDALKAIAIEREAAAKPDIDLAKLAAMLAASPVSIAGPQPITRTGEATAIPNALEPKEPAQNDQTSKTSNDEVLPKDDLDTFIFRRDGDGYYVQGFGESGRFSTLKGFRQIHQLLVSNSVLNTALVKGAMITANVSLTDLDNNQFKKSNSNQQAADKDTIKQVKERRDFLESRLSELNEERTPEAIDEIDTIEVELRSLKAYSQSSRGKAAKPRNINEENDRLRSAIHGTIETTCKKLRKNGCPELGNHFSNACQAVGKTHQYVASGLKINWVTE